MLILGRVGLGHFTCGSAWVGSRKMDPRPTLSEVRLRGFTKLNVHHHQSELVGDVAVPVSVRQAVLF